MALWTGQATATDPDVPTNSLTFSLVSGPPGFVVETNGAMSWTPSEADGPNTQQMAVRVTDYNPWAVNAQQLSVTNTFRLTINEVNRAPVPPTIAQQTIAELATLTVTNASTDPDIPANTLTYSLLDAPTDAAINPATGLITWTPTEAQGPSTNTFTVRTVDNGSPPLAGTNSFIVVVQEVNLPPALTVPTNQTINELVLWTGQATATDPDLPTNSLTFALVSGPTNLTVSAAGLIAWTPSEAQGPGVYPVSVKVTDNNPWVVNQPQFSVTNSFTLTVVEVNVAPVLAPVTNHFVDELTTLWGTNSATDSDIPTNTLTFQLVSAPTNMAIEAGTGLISWTPTEAQGPGSNWITVRVVDNGVPPLAATQSFAVIVREVNVAPVLPTIPPQTVMEGQLLTVNSAATDADLPPNALFYTLLSPPAGAMVDANGIVTWTPGHAQAGLTHTLRVKVTDDGVPPLSATNSFTVEVRFLNRPPVLDPIADKTVDEMTLLQFTATASDPDAGQMLTFSFGAPPPAGATLDPATGAFAWTPTEAQGPGLYPITLVVTDNGSAFGATDLSTTRTFNVTVREVNRPPLLAYIPDYEVQAGQTLTFRAAATDPDLPANTLRFELDVFTLIPPLPDNATLDPATGEFAWPATEAEVGNLFLFAVTVRDDGTPPLASSRVFLVEVTVRLSIALTAEGKPRLTWNSAAGNRYQVWRRAPVIGAPWLRVGPVLSATGSTLEYVDVSGTSGSEGYYRVELLGAP